jgi:Uma2 family endonuclease
MVIEAVPKQSPRRRKQEEASVVQAAAPPWELLTEPRRHRLTREEFRRACEIGLFGPEARLELIEGEVFEKVTQNSPHVTGVNLIQEVLRAVFHRGHSLRIQQPLALGEHSQPEPDIAVVTGTIRDYEEEHPTTAVLVVEVSDTTLVFDRAKAGLYARAGMPEYWILDLPDRVLEIYRQPAPMAGQPFGHHYRSITRHTEADTISPLAVPDAVIAVADLLPRARQSEQA